jgi:hypothetical protein
MRLRGNNHMPLIYDNFPPEAADVHYDPDFVGAINNGYDLDDDMVVLTVGEDDAYTLATVIKRDATGQVDLAEVRKGLAQAASALIEAAQHPYMTGVESFIRRNIGTPKQGVIV